MSDKNNRANNTNRVNSANNGYELFTLRNETVGQAGHWNTSFGSPYNGRNGNIEESNSANITEPTSIPSPFARMELARTAFAVAARMMNTAGKGWQNVPARYQKIVSDCLDVAEIFFNYPQFSQYVRIIKWSPQYDLLQMQNTELGKSIKKFLESDAASYNFNRMEAIYLLDYIGNNKPNKTGLNIIGATSPITMFFSVGNDLSYVSDVLSFNQDRPFDGRFTSLENRDIAFVKYLNLLRKEYNAYHNGMHTFAGDFSELDAYITAACSKVSNEQTNVINSGAYNYSQIDRDNSDYVKVLEFPIGCQNVQKPTQSDFEIASDTSLAIQFKPLVLPVNAGNGFAGCRYVSDGFTWQDNNHAPCSNPDSWSERVLPYSVIKYPYLTINDFFADKIIKIPLELNSESFFDGNLQDGSDREFSYLLPFKPLLFEFFTVEEVMNMTKMKVRGAVVEISLEIPIRNYTGRANNGKLKYVKKYQTNENIAMNIGAIVEAVFGLGVLPLYRPNDMRVAHYRVALFDKVGGTKLNFYNSTNNETVGLIESRKHREYADSLCSVETYVISKANFDRIAVSVAGVFGYVFPKFRSVEGTQAFKFAVDLGTTNTHIAYNVNNLQDNRAFNVDEPQMVKMHSDYKQYRDIQYAFIDCFMPEQIGTDDYKFPMRSAFAEDQRINYDRIQYTLADGNIPFRYEKTGGIQYMNIKTDEDLKWSSQPQRLALYIRNIVYMLHNKVLMCNGQLNRTEIVWFYPASMSTGMRSNMEEAWRKAYEDFFDADYNRETHNVRSMSESIAPYCFFNQRGGAVGIVTTIDIGGGTTDVYVSDGTHNNGYLSSFRFASNAVFGDGYNNNIDNNGFYNKYYNQFAGVLSRNTELSNALDVIRQTGKSTDLISFFFSLASTGEPGLDFTNMLRNDSRFKYPFVYFYTAILYNVAHSMKAKGIDLPKTVAFSGNGSKTLQILSADKTILEEFVKRIFEKVYGKEYPSNGKLQLIYNSENPKEATALGGLDVQPDQVVANPKPLNLLGVDKSTFASSEQYDNISENDKSRIVNEVEQYIQFVNQLNFDNFYGDKLGLDITILPRLNHICCQHLKEYLDLGLDKISKLLASDPTRTKQVNESLFFYPIVGMLNNLARELYVIN